MDVESNLTQRHIFSGQQVVTGATTRSRVESDLIIDAVVRVSCHSFPQTTRKTIRKETKTVLLVTQSGVVVRLASFLERSEDHKLQSEAANALANISAGTSENTCAVIDAGVVRCPMVLRFTVTSDSDTVFTFRSRLPPGCWRQRAATCKITPPGSLPTLPANRVRACLKLGRCRRC